MTLLIDIIKKLNGTHYLTGKGSKEYLKPELFEREQIEGSLAGF